MPGSRLFILFFAFATDPPILSRPDVALDPFTRVNLVTLPRAVFKNFTSATSATTSKTREISLHSRFNPGADIWRIILPGFLWVLGIYLALPSTGEVLRIIRSRCLLWRWPSGP